MPFWPLRYWDMEKIIVKVMQSQIEGHKFKHIEMDESAIQHFVNPNNIDYFEFKLLEGSYLFSKKGGHDLKKYSSLLDQIDKKIISNSFYNENDTVYLDYDGTKGLSMKLCSVWTQDEKICSTQKWSLG